MNRTKVEGKGTELDATGLSFTHATERTTMYTELLQADPERTFLVVLDVNEEAVQTVERFAYREHLNASSLTAIGAFCEAVLGFFVPDDRRYAEIPINDQTEVLSMVGNIVHDDGEPKLHAHVVLGCRDGTARGGHLLRGMIRPTLEIVVTETPAHLRRRHDPATGLALIRP
jgi:predicted DNA-binding protein with PD1-like motif